MKKHKRCPFCGGIAVCVKEKWLNGKWGSAYVWCTKCHIRTGTFGARDIKFAVKYAWAAWDRRAK